MLHLTAIDAEDLAVVSAQMQDAVIRFGDVKYLKASRQFALVANRFAWEVLPEQQRRRTGLNISSVLGVRRMGPKQLHRDTVLSLLAMTFKQKGDELSGTLELTFSAGHMIALDVECIDVALDDLGPVWATERAPEHGDTT